MISQSNVREHYNCAGSIGCYVWGLNGDQLAFAKEPGSCRAMDLVLTAHPFSRQQQHARMVN